MGSAVRKVVEVAVLVLVSACTGAPDLDYSRMPEFLYVPVNATGVVDRRLEFANLFCTLLEAEEAFSGRPCTDYLHLEDPEGVQNIEIPRLRPERLRYLIVPGYGSECFADVATPFEGAREVLQGEGIDVALMMVPGLASTARNAEFIARSLRLEPDQPAKDVVLIGYSKGLADILEAVVEYPDALSRVVAVVGVSGVVNGSPNASDAPMLLRMLANLPLSSCAGADADTEGIESIGYEYRQNWLSAHRLDARILYFSLAAYATVDEISSGLKSAYRRLARIDPRNDGLMIYRDAVIPDSYLLALARGDHWAVAMPFTESNAVVRAIVADRNSFPRTVLLRSIMIAVQRELDAREGR